MRNSRTLQQLAITAGLLALCSLPLTTRAQEAPQTDPQGAMQGQQAGPDQHGRKHDDELAKLNLSDDQKTQVKKIHQDARTQAESVRNDSTLSADQKHAKMEQIHKSARQQVEQILTPEQRSQWKSDEKARKAARQRAATPQQ